MQWETMFGRDPTTSCRRPTPLHGNFPGKTRPCTAGAAPAASRTRRRPDRLYAAAVAGARPHSERWVVSPASLSTLQPPHWHPLRKGSTPRPVPSLPSPTSATSRVAAYGASISPASKTAVGGGEGRRVRARRWGRQAVGTWRDSLLTSHASVAARLATI
eukprot:356382-Chlamydomonas_euryale.AAC.3